MIRQTLLAHLAAAFALVGCATKYSLVTEPAGIKVTAGTKTLGTTPLEFDGSMVEASETQGGGILLQLEGEGFKPLWLWMPRGFRERRLLIRMGGALSGATTVAAPTAPVKDDFPRQELYRIADQLLQVQTELLSNKDPKIEDLDALAKANSDNGSVAFLQALALLRQGKKPEAQALLQEAMKRAPQENDFLALFNELAAQGQ